MATLTYKGKVTFSDIVPALSQAADRLLESNDEVDSLLSIKQKGLQSLESRAAQLQKELEKATSVAVTAQETLQLAQNALEEAKSLVGSLASALSTSGIYHYNYVGRIDSMGSTVSSSLNSGLPDVNNPEETVVAVVLIVGGDGGTTETINRITGLVGQIGGNVSEIVALYNSQ